jgi:hypothetical protein
MPQARRAEGVFADKLAHYRSKGSRRQHPADDGLKLLQKLRNARLRRGDQRVVERTGRSPNGSVQSTAAENPFRPIVAASLLRLYQLVLVAGQRQSSVVIWLVRPIDKNVVGTP